MYKVSPFKNKLIFNYDKKRFTLFKTTSGCLFHKILFANSKFFNPKNLKGSQIVIKMILSDYKGLKIQNLF